MMRTAIEADERSEKKARSWQDYEGQEASWAGIYQRN
jgi:hypothetical protein